MKGTVSEEVQNNIKAALVRTQMKGTVSEKMQDQIKAGLLRTQLNGSPPRSPPRAHRSPHPLLSPDAQTNLLAMCDDEDSISGQHSALQAQAAKILEVCEQAKHLAWLDSLRAKSHEAASSALFDRIGSNNDGVITRA